MTNTTKAQSKAVGKVSGGTAHYYSEDGTSKRLQHVEVTATDGETRVRLDFYLDGEQLLAMLSGGSVHSVEMRHFSVSPEK